MKRKLDKIIKSRRNVKENNYNYLTIKFMKNVLETICFGSKKINKKKCPISSVEFMIKCSFYFFVVVICLF